LGFTLSSGLGSSKLCTFRTSTSRATKPIHSRRKLCHPPDHSTNIHMSHSSLNWHSSSSQSQSGTNSCWRPQEKSWTTSCQYCSREDKSAEETRQRFSQLIGEALTYPSNEHPPSSIETLSINCFDAPSWQVEAIFSAFGASQISIGNFYLSGGNFIEDDIRSRYWSMLGDALLHVRSCQCGFSGMGAHNFEAPNLEAGDGCCFCDSCERGPGSCINAKLCFTPRRPDSIYRWWGSSRWNFRLAPG
jgi:hypothetical protein